MKICVIGTGYVGLVTGSCLAQTGNHIICNDIDEDKINMLNCGELPIYEPGLGEILRENLDKGRINFTTDLDYAVKACETLFITVGTPSDVDGSADLNAVMKVAAGIGKAMNGYKIVVDKSTVPVGTAEKVAAVIAEHTEHEFDVVSNPEFLKEGYAVEDFMKPDRVVVGVDSRRAEEKMRELYSPFIRTGSPVIVMNVKSAEITKYAANAMLATKVTFMNEIANLCEKVGADVNEVRLGIGSDKRIGPQFLFPGVGYGGSCFPKDVRAIIRTAMEYDIRMKILESVHEVNEYQKNLLAEKLLAHFQGDLKGKTIALWGLAFKPRTDDVREAPSLTIIETLLKKGAKVVAYDPKAVKTTKAVLGDRIEYNSDQYQALEGAEALMLVTEWNEFREPDYELMKSLMKDTVIFDGRNIWSPKKMVNRGFTYYCIGRSALPKNSTR